MLMKIKILSFVAALLFSNIAIADDILNPQTNASRLTTGILPAARLGAVRTTSQPANPTAASSTAAPVMMGLAGSITPASSGNVLFLVNGQVGQSISGDGCFLAIRFGTGTAPVNGAAAVGTVSGNTVGWQASAANGFATFNLNGYTTGLTVGTAVWYDVAVQAITGGSCSLNSMNLIALEQ